MARMSPLPQRQLSFLLVFRLPVGFALCVIFATHCIQAQLGAPEWPMQPVYQDVPEFR